MEAWPRASSFGARRGSGSKVPHMKQAEFKDVEDAGGWGSGLLWPAARFVVIFALLAAVAHWAFGAAEVAQPQAIDVAQSVPPRSAALRESPEADEDGGRELAVRAERSGHFLVDAVVNGADVRFVVDTGASTLVLSRDDAARAGIDSHALVFSERFATANGVALGAPVTLREFRVGSFSLHDVRATVMAGPMPVSLLGMSVLSRFAGHEVQGDKLILRW